MMTLMVVIHLAVTGECAVLEHQRDVVSAGRQRNAQHGDVVRVETRLNALHEQRTAHQQTGGYEKNQRDGNFAHHQQSAQSIAHRAA